MRVSRVRGRVETRGRMVVSMCWSVGVVDVGVEKEERVREGGYIGGVLDCLQFR